MGGMYAIPVVWTFRLLLFTHFLFSPPPAPSPPLSSFAFLLLTSVSLSVLLVYYKIFCCCDYYFIIIARVTFYLYYLLSKCYCDHVFSLHLLCHESIAYKLYACWCSRLICIIVCLNSLNKPMFKPTIDWWIGSNAQSTAKVMPGRSDWLDRPPDAENNAHRQHCHTVTKDRTHSARLACITCSWRLACEVRHDTSPRQSPATSITRSESGLAICFRCLSLSWLARSVCNSIDDFKETEHRSDHGFWVEHVTYPKPIQSCVFNSFFFFFLILTTTKVKNDNLIFWKSTFEHISLHVHTCL